MPIKCDGLLYQLKYDKTDCLSYHKKSKCDVYVTVLKWQISGYSKLTLLQLMCFLITLSSNFCIEITSRELLYGIVAYLPKSRIGEPEKLPLPGNNFVTAWVEQLLEAMLWNICQTLQHYIPEDNNLYNHHCKNLIIVRNIMFNSYSDTFLISDWEY
jgi:hypothetical protein